MFYAFKTLCFIFVTAISIQTAHAEGAPERDFPQKEGYLPAPEQHRAIVDCHFAMGKSGHPKLRATYVAYPWGGDTVLRILPDYHVTPAEAARINACADTKLGRPSSEVHATPVDRSRRPCPRYAPTIYGGARYCIGNHL